MADSSSSFSTVLPPNLSLLIANLNSLITIKLDSSNYNLWKSQLYNLLHATGLVGYVDGTILPPLQFILDESNEKQIKNPEYDQWSLYDSHLLSCITATLSQPVYASVLHCTSSFEVWTDLAKKYTTLSRSHLHHLKNKLSGVRKTGTMEEYLQEIKTISDQLALASSPTDDEDLVLYTLNGLPEEYNAFKTTIRNRSGTISMAELSSLLCTEALHIEPQIHNKQRNEPVVAYSVAKSGSQFSGGKPQHSSYSQSSFRGNSRGFQRGGRGRNYSNYSSNRGRYSGNSGGNFGKNFKQNFSSEVVICQICGKANHSASECWHRMNAEYQPRQMTSGSSNLSSHSGNSPTFGNNKAYVAAMPGTFASASSSSTPWYVDSGPTNHITNDLSQLNFYEPYHGSDQVTVGNGSSLPIHHTGQNFQSSTF